MVWPQYVEWQPGSPLAHCWHIAITQPREQAAA